ncbi:MAG: ABC transporter permease subunit [Bacteriovoracaceae bacterium]|nr:ABC transporter permease subunit [Bacteriovoracaceae bacterium]
MRLIKLRETWILFVKEIKDVFQGPLIYILTGTFCLLIGWLFFNYLLGAGRLTSLNMTSAVIVPIFGNMNFMFLFLAPMLTMRLIAGEKKAHTIELLFISNLNHFQIIVAKFMASLCMVLFMLLFTVVFPVILHLSGYSDWGTVGSAYLGMILSIMCYLSVGMFTSSLTENQIVAAFTSFGILMGLMLLVVSVNATNNWMLGNIVQYLSIPVHYESFVRGAIRSYDFVYFFSFIGFFLWLTDRSLESRNW